jgi:dTDP-4-dehydrorhamnose reductase
VRILLLGRDGQLGQSLLRELGAESSSAAGTKREQISDEVTAVGRAEVDFTDPAQVRAAIERWRPEMVVNAAAYTAVDKAESEPELAMRINAESVGALGEAARQSGARVIHYSTDYVFDGEKHSAYVETDATRPLNVYGRSKLAGEEALLASGADALILRTSWIFAASGKNFVQTMLRLGQQQKEVRVVDDQVGAPTAAGDLAAASAQVIKQWNGQRGIYHAASTGAVSWCGLARKIFQLAGLDVTVTPIASEDWVTLARRPKNSRLDCGKLEREFGVRMLPWEQGLERVIKEISGRS